MANTAAAEATTNIVASGAVAEVMGRTRVAAAEATTRRLAKTMKALSLKRARNQSPEAEVTTEVATEGTDRIEVTGATEAEAGREATTGTARARGAAGRTRKKPPSLCKPRSEERIGFDLMKVTN